MLQMTRPSYAEVDRMLTDHIAREHPEGSTAEAHTPPDHPHVWIRHPNADVWGDPHFAGGDLHHPGPDENVVFPYDDLVGFYV